MVEALAESSAAMGARGFRRDLSEAAAIDSFERHNDSVRASVAADRLLVYEVEQGWAALCSFLGAAVPDEPFPRGNDAAAFHENVARAGS